MLVRLLVQISGTRDGKPWPPKGNEVDLPDDEARQMISALQAVPVTRNVNVGGVEYAVVPAAGSEYRDAVEKPLTTKTGPVPPRKGALK